MIRSEERIPKLRSRGRANRRNLLMAAERLLTGSNGTDVRFSDVFESAGGSRGSAYRIYIGMDDLMQDLAGEWVNNCVVYMNAVQPDTPFSTWQELSDFMVLHGAQYWRQSSETMRVLPRARSNSPASYKQALADLSQCVADMFERHFIMPEIDNWHGKLNFYAQLADLSYADSVRRFDGVTDERVREAQALCREYLSFHLPERLQVRQI